MNSVMDTFCPETKFKTEIEYLLMLSQKGYEVTLTLDQIPKFNFYDLFPPLNLKTLTIIGVELNTQSMGYLAKCANLRNLTLTRVTFSKDLLEFPELKIKYLTVKNTDIINHISFKNLTLNTLEMDTCLIHHSVATEIDSLPNIKKKNLLNTMTTILDNHDINR